MPGIAGHPEIVQKWERYPETIGFLDGPPAAPYRPGCEARTSLFSELKPARPGQAIRIEQARYSARSSSGALSLWIIEGEYGMEI